MLGSIARSIGRHRALRGALCHARPPPRAPAARSSVCMLSRQTRRLCSSQAAASSDVSNARLSQFRAIFSEVALHDDEICRNDFALGMHNALPDAKIDEEQLERMFRIGDLDNSGSIDFDEFITLFDGIPDENISLKTLAERWIGFSSTSVLADPEMIFSLAWRSLTLSSGGEESVRLPREILFLGGAPGAGKGTMTPYIMRERGLDNAPIVMSSLLQSPAAKKIIDEGGLVSDMEVFSMLLAEVRQLVSRSANASGSRPIPATPTLVPLPCLLSRRCLGRSVTRARSWPSRSSRRVASSTASRAR